jgi:tetratricopeptide (TPR) repeat protein/predicted aspartyl protease
MSAVRRTDLATRGDAERRRPAAGRPGFVGFLLAPALLATAAPAQAGKCTIARMEPELAVTMRNMTPLVHAQINGQDALFIADSGMFFSSVGPATVREFQMRLDSDPAFQGLSVWGVGGREKAQVAWAKTFTIIGMTLPNIPFVVAGSDWGNGAVGLLGQNVFRLADVEYDLANGVIRFVQAKDCKGMPLAYWASAADKPYSVTDIDLATAREPHTKSIAYLNGMKIRVIFDTGAATSLMTLGAAKHAGITPESAGVEPGGTSQGFGHRVAKTWIAHFASFKIGDEEIHNARLRFGDVELLNADMLVGADFFLSHRIFVASSQRKLYFTYNGGPVFNLATSPASPSAAEAQSAAEAPVAGASKAVARAGVLDQPTDAAGYARRGAASAARHDYESAIADLTRACELAPTESGFFYERGAAHWSNKQPDAALADFDQAIKLKPDNVDALIVRATLRAARHDPADAVTGDLEAADRAAPKESAVHIRIGNVYESLEQPAAAVDQYSKWIDSHPRDDLGMPAALNARCWARALLGQELDRALADCNAAVKMRPDTAAFLDSRGLVHLRQTHYDKAIADYDAALRLQPKIAWSLYGRGLAKLRQGKAAEGQADIAAATAREPRIAARAAKFGLGP